ncbi:hypothetical protein Tco_1370027 [Tanacetum coccineum]
MRGCHVCFWIIPRTPAQYLVLQSLECRVSPPDFITVRSATAGPPPDHRSTAMVKDGQWWWTTVQRRRSTTVNGAGPSLTIGGPPVNDGRPPVNGG